MPIRFRQRVCVLKRFLRTQLGLTKTCCVIITTRRDQAAQQIALTWQKNGLLFRVLFFSQKRSRVEGPVADNMIPVAKNNEKKAVCRSVDVFEKKEQVG